MKKFYRAIVENPKKIMLIFLAAAVICGLLKGFVLVNYDIKDYLPDETASTVSLELMKQEFDGGIPNARVMVRNVTIPEALSYKEKILQCDGVTDVTWLDDAVNIVEPVETLDSETVETYYKEKNALFTVTIDEEKFMEATDEIRELIGDENAMSGDAVSTAVATTSTVKEVQKISIIAVLFVIFMLILTTSSWVEPVVVMLGLGIAILINSGTNLIFGEISFVTNAAGSILQLAVSLDYSVFLIHRFEECMKETSDPKEAMVDALLKSTSSILSSGLTTVIGFLALVFMRFKLGSDLGLALAKGVAISLITVFVFMPVLILAMHRWMEKTHHKRLLPDFHRFGRFVCKIMFPMVLVFVVLIVPSYLASNSNSFYYGSSHIFGSDTQL
ncbi:MAG: MMPL family transporter, partial [Lachnospiraceae bacterium]|nr:MMPL family transporter [Lachnospiraceae bacterium]